MVVSSKNRLWHFIYLDVLSSNSSKVSFAFHPFGVYAIDLLLPPGISGLVPKIGINIINIITKMIMMVKHC